MLSAFTGHTEVAKALIKSGADIDAIEEDGLTALITANSMGHTEIANLLKEAGAAE